LPFSSAILSNECCKDALTSTILLPKTTVSGSAGELQHILVSKKRDPLPSLESGTMVHCTVQVPIKNMDEEDLSAVWVTDESGEAEENKEQKKLVNAKRGILFLVDCHEQMFQNTPSRFSTAIKLISLCLKRKVFTSPQTVAGIIFFGCAKSNCNIENVFELQLASRLKVEKLKELQDISTDLENGVYACPEAIGGPGNSNRTALGDAMFLGIKRMKESGFVKFEDEQTIWLISNDETPDFGDEKIFKNIETRIRDVLEAGFSIEIWPQEKVFDGSKFYERVTKENDNVVINKCTHEQLDSDLKDQVKKRDVGKRRLAPVTINMGNNLSFGMDLYPMFIKASIQTQVKLDPETGANVRTETRMLCPSEGIILTPDQVGYFLEYGESLKVKISPEDIRKMKQFGNAGVVTTLGFKPFDQAIKPWYVKRPSYLLTPSNSRIEGSTSLFAALLQVMLDKNQVMIATVVLRNNEPLKLVALIPQQEKKNGDGDVVEAAGFQMIFLPWAHDIRPWIETPKDHHAKVDNETISKAKAMFEKMECDLDDNNRFIFPENPAIQKHYAYLEKLALTTDTVDWKGDEECDETRPYELDASMVETIETFSSSYGGTETEEDAKKLEADAKKKRTGTSSSSSKAVKKVKAEVTDWRKHTDNLGQFTLAQLKLICSELQVPVSGKKEVLIARILEIDGEATLDI